jgi:hypothetical protein
LGEDVGALNGLVFRIFLAKFGEFAFYEVG